MTSAKTGGTALYRYEPDYAIPPGDIIAEFIEEQGMTQVELARRLGVTPKHLNQLIGASVSLSNELAIALERVTGTPAKFWNALEANFQDFEAREREVDDLSADLPWLDELPLKELISRGHIPEGAADPSINFGKSSSSSASRGAPRSTRCARPPLSGSPTRTAPTNTSWLPGSESANFRPPGCSAGRSTSLLSERRCERFAVSRN